jgi:biotin synthesis protein BioG
VRDQIDGHIRHAVALNGTPCPIDERYGIPKAVYEATVREFNETTRKKFFKRMCHSPETLRWFAPHQPQRPFEEQREELLAIQRFVMQQPQNSLPPLFTCALISRHDRIMPTQHQIRYWRGTVDYRVIDSPHCAFRQWENWKEIFDDVATD